MNELARTISKKLLEPNSELEFKIRTNTELYRKGFGQIRLHGKNGEPVENAEIVLRQKTHEYKFGCNLFMLGQFPNSEQNAELERIFPELFNLAVAPFYWSDLEPEEGRERFSRDSPFRYRRPAPDAVCDYCEANGLAVKGHPLAWARWWPEWVPEDPVKIRDLWERRFSRIAEHYAKRIRIWDVFNEAQTVPDHRILPEHPVETAFELAARYFPGCKLNYNDDNMWFRFSGENTPPYLLVEKLLRKNLKVSGLGFQFHMFDFLLRNEGWKMFMDPEKLYQIYDCFSLLKLPINISEVSIISRKELGDGDRFQELVAEKLYRLWFSHPATDGIVWWNLVDGTASGAPLGSQDGENALRAGLLNYDFSPKPVYRALRKLIREEWHTENTLRYSRNAENRFHGFYGTYLAEIKTDSGTFQRQITLSKNSSNLFDLIL